MGGRELRKRPIKTNVPEEKSSSSKRPRRNEPNPKDKPSTSKTSNTKSPSSPRASGSKRKNSDNEDQPSTPKRSRVQISPPNSPVPSNNGNNRPQRRRYQANGPVRDPLDLSDLTLRDRNVDHFYLNLKDEAIINENYQLLTYNTEFHIQNIKDSKNPAGLLYTFFDETIKIALNLAKEKMKGPFSISILLHNSNLEKDIGRPFRTVESDLNNAMTLLREFAKAQQSARYGSLLEVQTRLKIIVKGTIEGKGCQNLSNM